MDVLAAIDENILACKVELLQVQRILQPKAASLPETRVKKLPAAEKIDHKLYLISIALGRMSEHRAIRRILDNDIHAGHVLHKRMTHFVKELADIHMGRGTDLNDSVYQQFTIVGASILHALDVFLLDIDADESLKAVANHTTNLWKAYIETGNKSADALESTLISIGKVMRKLPKDKSYSPYTYLRAIGVALVKNEPTLYISDLSYPPGWGRHERQHDIYDEALREPV